MKRKNLPGPSGEDLKETANPDQATTTDSGSKRKLGRRGFLKLGAGATAAALATPVESIVAQQRTRGFRPGAALQAVQGECNAVDFSEPKPVWVQPNNVLETTLNAEGFQWTYTCPGDPTKYTGLQPVFNSAVPGPSLYVNPGSTLNITLNNKLNNMPKFKNEDKNCPANHHLNPPKPACYQHTNLHFHGFQVSPCSLDMDGKLHCGPIEIDADHKLKCSSDDVLVDIAPGYSNQYCVVLPDMHAPGTNWYHSHLHGASAYQVSGGMSGAIIIREPTLEAQIVRQDLDKVFVLQEVLLNPKDFSTVETPPVYGTPGQAPPDTTVFVNGLCRPTLTMQSGQMMRWRFINTGPTPRGLMTLKLIKSTTCTGTVPDPVPKGEVMFLIAIDGLSFYGVNPQPVRYHLMGPGSRADFLVKLEPGIYTLLKDAFPLESVTKPDSTNYTNASSGSKEVLAYIEVVDSKGAYDDKIPNIIPGKKPDYLKAIWTVDCVREKPIQFQNPGGGQFKIDNGYYPDNTAIVVKLNTAEEWTLQNSAGPVPQSNTHPFHVHLNPFQILGVPFDFEVTDDDRTTYFPKVEKMDPKNPETWPFWDTVPIPGANSPNADKCPQCTPPPVTSLKIRSRFLIYDGEYVTHCHILIHEDVGMMINVKLIGDGIGPNEAVHDYPPAARACIDRTSIPPKVPPKPCPSPSPTPTPAPKH